MNNIPEREKPSCKPLPPDVQKVVRSGVPISGFVRCVEELVRRASIFTETMYREIIAEDSHIVFWCLGYKEVKQ